MQIPSRRIRERWLEEYHVLPLAIKQPKQIAGAVDNVGRLLQGLTEDIANDITHLI